MKQIWGGALSIALLAASPNASAQHGHYFFQHQTSITETTNGCILSILSVSYTHLDVYKRQDCN